MSQPANEKTNRPPSRIFLRWLICLAASIALVAAVDMSTPKPSRPAFWVEYIGALLLSLVFLGPWYFIGWCRSWQNLRRVLLGGAVLGTLVAIFYTEEYWRGKHAWDNYRHELEAKGAVLDWEKFIPAPVPDDQNFFMTSSNIRIRFVKAQNDAQIAAQTNLTWLNASYKDFPSQRFSSTNAPVMADLIVVPLAMFTTNTVASLSLSLDDSNRAEKIQGVIRATLGRCVNGAAGFRFSEFDLGHRQPARILLAADVVPSVAEFKNLIPSDLATNIGRLQLEPTADPKMFQVKLIADTTTPAAEYLRWSDQFAPAFDEIREALKRPYAMVPGDYSEPYLMPIPNFVTMRWLAQTLAQRVQCHILIGEPGKALPDLTLMHDVCRILEHQPTGRPMTLVEAMINVAITGLYTETVKNGLRNHCWNEAELATLQAQLKEDNLRPYLIEAFRDERVHTVRLGERANFEKLLNGELFGYHQKRPLLENLGAHMAFGLIPQGWIFQNLKLAVKLNQNLIESTDESSAQISPKKIESAMREMKSVTEHRTPFNLLASISVPNFTKAFQTFAYNQTMANETQIVCALERYHLARGGYPESLEYLVPQFMDKIPGDVISVEGLHYRRTNTGSFILYSVGWNETDDDGRPGSLNDPKNGDWVWQ